MIRLLYAVTDGNVGGAGRVVLSLLRHADRSRFAPALALPAESALRREAEALDVPLYPIRAGADRSASAAAFFEYCALLRRERFDVLHAHAALSASLAAAVCRVPVRISTRHCAGAPPPGAGIFRRLLRNLPPERSLAWIAVSESAAASLAAEGVPDSRIRLIPNGAERFLRADVPTCRALRGTLGIPDGARVIGFFGRLERVKGADLLPAFAAALAARLPACRILVCGDGTLAAPLREAARTIPNLRLCGFVRDPAPYLSLCDALVSLSRAEASPLALTEALGMGIPVVAPALPACKTLLADAGSFFPPGDAGAAADATAALLRDPARLCARARAAELRAACLPGAAKMTADTESYTLALLARTAAGRKNPDFSAEKSPGIPALSPDFDKNPR